MPAPTPPRVSVIVPAFNAEPFLGDAIRSVLDQTLRDLEIVVVDDGSSDRTRELAERMRADDSRIRVVERANGGPSAARNTGLASARGEFVCFLDADDIYLPDKLERQVGFLDRFPGCDLVFSDYYVGDSAGTPIWLENVHPRMTRMDEYLLYRNRFAPLCPLLRARLASAAGGFDERLRGGEDWEYWLRAAQHGTFSYLPGPVGVYRTHASQAHHDRNVMRSDNMRIAQSSFVSGSRRWRVMMASRAWAEAREAWWDRRLWLIPLKLAEFVARARSPRIMVDVARWA